MQLEINLLPVFGAELIGWDFKCDPDHESIDFLRQTLLQHRMILLRDQSLSPAELVAFTHLFGTKLFVGGKEFWYSKKYKNVFRLTNQAEQGNNRFAGELWHCDGHYLNDPSAVTVTYALQTAPGGAICVRNLSDAYDIMPDSVKPMLPDLRCINLGSGVIQPLVRKHPATGRVALYVNLYARTIDPFGNKLPDADRLLGSVLEQDSYKHEWQPGDVIIVDNIAACHRVYPAAPAHEEIMLRSQTIESSMWWHDTGVPTKSLDIKG